MKTKTASKKPIEVYLFILFLILFFTIDLFSQSQKIQIHGHRGARSIYPENTLPAFKYALENEMDVLELDLAVTLDKEIVVTHNPVISSEICLDPKGKRIQNEPVIYKMTLAEVQKYDCGSIKNKKFPKQKPIKKEKIPTLQEVFDLVLKSDLPHSKKVEFNIETKLFPNEPDSTPSPEEFAQLLYKLIEKNNLVNRVIVQSFDYRSLKEMKRLNPKVRTSQLISDNLIDMTAVAKSSSVDFISPDWKWITADEVRKLQQMGVKVAPWTANEESEWQKLIDMKVDAIITDDPVSLKRYLKY